MTFSSLWMWIKALGPALLVVERITVTLAALVGFLTLWQYLDEREERALDRSANFISALHSCIEGAKARDELTLEFGQEAEQILEIVRSTSSPAVNFDPKGSDLRGVHYSVANHGIAMVKECNRVLIASFHGDFFYYD